MTFHVLVVAAVVAGTLGAPHFDIGSYDGRIVNGTDAKEGQYPFQVSLRNQGRHSCGGTILNANWVLTAAHCVAGGSAKYLSIQAGTIDISSSSTGVTIPIAEIRAHTGYDPYNNYIHDIAVLKLQQPLTFSDLIQPVPLPKQMEDTPGGTPATVIGWGRSSSGGPIMTHLQTVDIQVYSDEACSEAHYNKPHPSNICAGVPEGGKGQCNGDSGGPLIANGHQVGIVSWSVKPCTVKGYPGVFTEVSYYIQWINDNIN